MKIAWITDSASCIDLSYAQAHNIHVIPLHVIFGGESYKDMIEIDEDEFYRRIANGEMPSTSQPAVGDFVDLYNTLKGDGYDAAIAIHISSHLSGTMSTSMLAAKLTDFPVSIIDSGLVAKPIQFLIEEGLRLAKEDKAIADIISGIESMRERIVGYFIINDLQFLHRGGRIGATSALIGSILQVKPVLQIEYQRLDIFRKVRTLRKAKEFLFQLLDQDVQTKNIREINVVHAHHLQEALNWGAQLKQKFQRIPVSISTLGTVVGGHSGPNAIGLTWV